MNFPFFQSKSAKKPDELQSQLDTLSNQFDELLEENYQLQLSKSFGDSYGSDPIMGQFGLVDEQYDKSSLQKLFMTEGWFYIAVNTIAKSIASLPQKIEKKKIIKQRVIQPNGKEEEVYKETWVEASAEPEANIFVYPNDLQSQMDFWYLIVCDILATGEAFIHPFKEEKEYLLNQQDRLQEAIDKVRKTDVSCLYRINSALTEAVASDDPEKIIEGYLTVTDSEPLVFEPEEIVHIRLPNPSNPLGGLAPIVPVMKRVLLDRYTDEHHIRFYKQGARLGGAIETTKKLTQEQIRRLTKTFESQYTGKRQHHRTLILPEGMKYNIIEQSPVDSALIEFSKTNKEPILSAYNLPPIKVGLLDGATFANALIQNKTYYVDTIMPITTLIEQAINKSESILKSSRNLRFRFDFSQIEALQDDYKSKAEAGTAMANSGMTINEVRQRVWNLPPLEGGDVTPAINKTEPFIPFNSLSADQGDIKVDANNAQNDTQINSDILPTEATFESRVAQLINEAVAEGLDVGVATERAIQQALEEGFIPTRLSPPEEEEEDKSIDIPFSKEALISYAKNVNGEMIDPIMLDRRKEFSEFMDRLEKFIIGNLSKKAFRKEKSFGIKISLPKEGELKAFIEKESQRVAESMVKATQHGYKYNLPSRQIAFPNDKALTILKKIATRNVKSVSQSSLSQLKNIITSSISEQTSVGEITARIQDAFKNITASKAETIARTETLSAVSIGQDLKSKEFRSLFPKEAKNMRRVWIDARDSKVRDSHADNNNVVVKVGQPFPNGLLYPRDPAGPASEVINCRCSFVDFLPDDQEDILSITSGGSDLV